MTIPTKPMFTAKDFFKWHREIMPIPGSYDSWDILANEANKVVAPLLEEHARLRAALEFYADKKHWFPVGMNDCCKEIHVMDCKNDNVGGERARAALSGKGDA